MCVCILTYIYEELDIEREREFCGGVEVREARVVDGTWVGDN